jgi:hypothetical protein
MSKLTPQYHLQQVGVVAAIPGTAGAFTQAVFKGAEVPDGQPVFAYVQRPMVCTCCGTTENLHDDFGSGGPYRCNDPDCIPF